MNSLFWTLSFVLMIGGGIAVAASRVSRSLVDRQEHYRGRATATVVAIEIDEPDERGQSLGIHDYYYAVLAYYAAGKLYQKRYEKGGNPCPFTMNQKIEIQYDTERPERFTLRRKRRIHYLSPLLYYGGMCACVAGGILFLLAALRFF